MLTKEVDLREAYAAAKKDVAVFPISDIQYAPGLDSAMCSVSRVEEYLDWTIDRYADCARIFIGTGDYVDVVAPTQRKLLDMAYQHTREPVIEYSKRATLELAQLMHPRTASSTYGLLMHGHHYMRFDEPYEDTFNTDQLLAKYLGFDYSNKWLNLVKVRLTDDHVFKLLCSHGSRGGGALAGSFFNMLEKQATRYDDVDAVIFSHANRIGAVPVPFLNQGEDGKWRDRHAHLIASGSFSRSLSDGGENYAEQRNYPPLGIGATALRLRINRKGRKVIESTVWT